MKYSTSKFNDTMRSIMKPAHNLLPGTILTLESVIENGNVNEDGVNDILVFTTEENRFIEIKLKTILSFHKFEGDFYNIEGDYVQFADTIEVIHSEDRMTRDGSYVYPLHAYKGFPDIMAEYRGDELVKQLQYSGVREDFDGSAKQNITFKVH